MPPILALNMDSGEARSGLRSFSRTGREEWWAVLEL